MGANNILIIFVGQASLEVIDLDTASLWWAGKEMTRGKKLRDIVGKNEKTKIVCKLQKVSISVKTSEVFAFYETVQMYVGDASYCKVEHR